MSQAMCHGDKQSAAQSWCAARSISVTMQRPLGQARRQLRSLGCRFHWVIGWDTAELSVKGVEPVANDLFIFPVLNRYLVEFFMPEVPVLVFIVPFGHRDVFTYRGRYDL